MKHAMTEIAPGPRFGIWNRDLCDRDRVGIGRVLVLAVGLIATCGCPSQSRSRPGGSVSRSIISDPARTAQDQDEDHFDLSLNYLDTLEQYDDVTAQQRILYHLIQWSQNQRPADDWIADPMYARLPSRLQIDRGAAALSRIEFAGSDVYALREAIWMRDLVVQIGERPLNQPRFDDWLSAQVSQLGADAAHDLEMVTAYFDWVVRNVQLESPVPSSTDAEDATATPRPGASRTAWGGLLLGRGDAWVRARIFVRIARQRGIPVVILGFDEDEQEPRPWVAAALIADRLFLFDTQLGLPLPTGDGRGIATFSELRKNYDWLRQLDVGQRNPYGVAEEDLRRVVALLDAPPESLTQRMKLVESQMSGERRLSMVVSPSSLKKQLQKIPGLIRTELWTAPYDALIYQAVTARDPELMRQRGREFTVFGGGTPLSRARREHFRGRYDNQPAELGAKGYYLQCRMSDAEIRNMQPPDELKQTPGWDRLPADRQDQIMDAMRQQMTVVKQYASYWLGLIAYENEQYPTAISYFERRTLQASPNGPWTQGATYNLARTYELLGRRHADHDQLERARQLYRSDRVTPQRHGNLLRARWIDQLLAAGQE